MKLTGEAVKSLTVTFLEMWNVISEKDADDTNLKKYLPDIPYTSKERAYVLPYADSPMDEEQVGEEVYISMAEAAQKYV